MPRVRRLLPVRPFPVASLLLSLLLASVASADPKIVLGSWAPTGGQAGARFGASVAPAGDVNGDGYSDVLVGAPLSANPEAEEGRAYLYLGSASGLAASPAWTWEPNQAGAHAGTCVAPAGDVNRDGYADVLVCAPLYDRPSHVDGGAVFVFYGSASGLPATPNATLADDVTGAKFGSSACTAGDVNGDQYADVIVGAPEFANGEAKEGAAYVYLGSVTGLATTSSLTVEGNQVDAQLGFAVSTAGDVNCDSYADVLIGAPGGSNNGHIANGFAIVLKGTNLGVDPIPIFTTSGAADSAAAGGGVSLAGDVNSDGYADIVIGLPGSDGSGARRGEYQIFVGMAGGVNPAPVVDASGIGDGSRVGAAVATGGDIDGDGAADVLVGNPVEPGSGDGGSVSTYFGVLSGALAGPVLHGISAGEHFGASVATAGDFDGDGRAEILAGCPEFGGQGRVLSFVCAARLPVLASSMPLTSGGVDTRFGTGLAILPYAEASAYRGHIAVGEPAFGSPGPYAGRVQFFQARAVRVQTPAQQTLDAAPEDLQFGYWISDAGDVNRDGFSDFAVSAPFAGTGGVSGRGHVTLYLGGGAFSVASPWVGLGTAVDDNFGITMAGRGDVNGDGYSDLLVSALNEDAGPLGNVGKVRLYLGGPSGLGAESWSAQGTAANQYFGYALAMGDFDGDGYSDAAITDSPGIGAGNPALRVYFGGPGGLAAQPAWTIVPQPVLGTYGGAVANIGDFNGDGAADIAVGASDDFGGAGAVLLYLGSRGRAQPPGPFKTYIGRGPEAAVGYAIGGGSDLNGDGFDDFVVGAPFTSNPESSEGRLLVFLGSGTPRPLLPDTTYESNVIEASLGTTVAPLADLNADGYADIAAAGGSTGRVYVYFGGGRSTYRPFEATEAMTGTIRFAPARLDSATMVGCGMYLRSAEGRTRASLRLELQPQSVPFTGIANRPELNLAYYDTGPPMVPGGSASPAGAILTGLGPGVTYHLRGRAISRSPYFPRTTWFPPTSRVSGYHDFRTGGANVAVGIEPAAKVARLGRIAPNPAIGTTAISFVLPARADVGLDVYDVRGRHVRALGRAGVEAGPGSIAWDGVDNDGRRVPPGIYFVELRVGGVVDRSRIVRLSP